MACFIIWAKVGTHPWVMNHGDLDIITRLAHYGQMDIIKQRKIGRNLEFIGNSKEMIGEFPGDVKRKMGYALRYAQWELKHEHAKPFKGLGSGIFEIVEDFSGD